MTPEQKANDLIEKFRALNVTLLGCGDPSNPCIITSNMLEKSAIQCAIVAVDEILEATHKYDHKWKANTVEVVKMYSNFWQEVKTQLNKKLK